MNTCKKKCLPAADTGLDCMGMCDKYIERNGQCVEVGTNQAAAGCDGVAGSDAFINKCGVCVGGTNGLPVTEGTDECGECKQQGEQLARECTKCGEKMDDCRVCRKPTDANWNSEYCFSLITLFLLLKIYFNEECRTKPLKIKPDVLDQIVSSTFLLKFLEASIHFRNNTVTTCKISDSSSGAELTAQDALCREGYIEATFTNVDGLATGAYTASCSVAPTSSPGAATKYESVAGALSLVDTASCGIVGVRALPNPKTRMDEIIIKLTRSLSKREARQCSCFYRVKGDRAQPAKSLVAVVNPNERSVVKCTGQVLSGQEYEVGIVLSSNMKTLR